MGMVDEMEKGGLSHTQHHVIGNNPSAPFLWRPPSPSDSGTPSTQEHSLSIKASMLKTFLVRVLWISNSRIINIKISHTRKLQKAQHATYYFKNRFFWIREATVRSIYQSFNFSAWS